MEYEYNSSASFFHSRLTNSSGEGVQLLSSTPYRDLDLKQIGQPGEGKFQLLYLGWVLDIEAPSGTEQSPVEYTKRTGVFRLLLAKTRNSQRWCITLKPSGGTYEKACDTAI